jgi:O-antigen/teichoic acid export membrane protein
MRKKRLAWNTTSSFVFQITTIICGFILPRMILEGFGSEVNGLVNSIMQFLQIIAFLDLGVGSVVKSSLYKPLSNKDNIVVSKIAASAEKFFRRIAQILLVYIVILIFIYPLIVDQSFGFIYTATLILAMSISSFAQYYFGVVNRLLLTADQRGYVQYNAQTVTVILNTVACVLLIKFGAGIQFVKLTTSLIYISRPLYLYWYVNKHYKINRKISYEGEPIKQKWNGLAQHVAAVVLDSTDTIVLSLFSTLSNVSIYSVYFMVIHGVKQLFTSMINGIQSLIGELWAKKEIDKLNETFAWTEWTIHTGTTFLFGCTGVLIIPFVQVYAKGITDVNYVVPLFAALITLAHAMHCLRIPYNLIILACGHYRETQRNYIIAVIMNVVLSVVTVKIWGLVGVAIGTLVAMAYQTIWMAYYDSKNLIKWPFKNFLKQFSVDIATVLSGAFLTSFLRMADINYLDWIILAVKTTMIWSLIVLGINLVFYRNKVYRLFSMFAGLKYRLKKQKK